MLVRHTVAFGKEVNAGNAPYCVIEYLQPLDDVYPKASDQRKHSSLGNSRHVPDGAVLLYRARLGRAVGLLWQAPAPASGYNL